MISFEERVLQLVNIERAAVGLSPLEHNPLLAAAAGGHASAMIESDFFGHQGPEGETADARAATAGYGGGVGENLAAGFSTPEDTMDALMASPGHRANILHPDYKSLGVGYAFIVPDSGAVNFNHYWVQNFGLERAPSEDNPNAVSIIDNALGGHTITIDDAGLLDASLGTSGVDLVETSVSIFPLPSSIEHAAVVQAGALNLTGNGLANGLTGAEGPNRLRGDSGDDLLRGLGGDDFLHGNIGDDTAIGGQGDDEIRGGGGNDDLRGSRGHDQVIGGRGNDTINGGTGDDSLSGLGDGDYFVFDQLGNGVFTGEDVVTDFTPGLDRLVFASLVNDVPFVSPDAVLEAFTVDADGNAHLDLGAGGSVTLLGVNPDHVKAEDIAIL